MLQVKTEANEVCLSGVASMQSLNAKRLAQVVNGCLLSNVDSLNLEAVTQADSACVGLLLAVLKARKQAGLKPIIVRHLPPAIRALNTLYELDSVIIAS